MLFKRDRMLRKLDEFDLDGVIATRPENVSYMSDLQSQLPYMYRFLLVTNNGCEKLYPHTRELVVR